MHSEVTIIGGGIAGVSAAYYLAKDGVKVRLIDKEAIASQQSGRNWGFIRRHGCHPYEVPLVKDSARCWASLSDELGPDLGVIRKGCISLASDLDRLEQFHDWVQQTNAEQTLGSQVISADAVRELLPGIQGEWLGALYSADDAHAVPTQATRTLAAAAERAGAVLDVGTTVLGIRVNGDRVVGVRTSRGDLETGILICAAGAWSSRLLRPLGVELPIRWVRGTAARTNSVEPITDLAVATPSVGFSQAADGAITFGTTAWSDYDLSLSSFRHLRLFVPNLMRNRAMFRFHVNRLLAEDVLGHFPGHPRRHNPFVWPWVDQPPPNVGKVERAHESLKKLLPKLADSRIQQIWAGYIDITPDALPVVGPASAVRGLYLATGLSSHGFGIGPGVGHAVAELAVKGTSSIDVSPFRLERFRSREAIAAHHHL